MPEIIDFDYYVDAMRIGANIRCFCTVLANEEVDGRYWNDLYHTIAGTSAIYGNINIDGTTYLGSAISATAEVSGSLTPLVALSLDIACTSLVTGLYEYGEGRGYLPRIVSFGADRELLSGRTYISALVSEAYSSSFIPPQLTQGLAFLTGLTSWGSIRNPTIGEGALGALVSKGWARDATEDAIVFSADGYSALRSLFSFAEDGERLTVMWYSKLLLIPFAEELYDLVVTFSSDLEFASVWIAERKLIASFLSDLDLTSEFSLLGSYILSETEALRIGTFFSGLLDQEVAAFRGATTWVFNVDTKSTVQYDRFAFNSFAKRASDYVAAAADGIYTLGGSTDAGIDIASLIELGVSRFETPQKKYFPAIYLGVTANNEMLLKVVVEGTTWYYEARNTSAAMQNQRIDLGKGLSGSHWQFTILNQDGADFDLESVEFMPLISTRRVF
jgi:hypothetical protein